MKDSKDLKRSPIAKDNKDLKRYPIARPVGHDDALAPIEAAIRASANDAASPLSHALIIAGPAGIGKFPVALWLGSRLKCDAPDQCSGTCPSCKKISIGTHPDVYVLDPEPTDKSLGISEITGPRPNRPRPKYPPGLIPRMSPRATQRGPVVAIVRDAHKLTPDAQSALLKTLEEPPGPALIVLVTDNLLSLFPTVRSRCQLLRLSRLDTSAVQEILRLHDTDADLARSAAAYADGSPGRALATGREMLEERTDLLTRFERCRQGKGDMDALVARLADPKAADKPGLAELYEWQMKKIEISLGRPHSEENDRLNALLIRLSNCDATERRQLLAGAESIHLTVSAIARNANKKLAIRDMLISIQDA
jgi:DNA polymerase-3 subunit delta'